MNRICIGRDSHNDIRIAERWDTVSNHHCDIIYENGQLTLDDHSSNGTVINGQKIQNRAVGIYPGDRILLANAFELEWLVIERFFPNLRRPTVTEHQDVEKQAFGRNTVQKNVEDNMHGRKTEQFENRPRQESDQWERDRRTSSIAELTPINSGEYSRSEIESELTKWNWGGFLCNWLWAAFNGIYWPLFIIFIAWIPYLGQVASLCLSVYLGLNGSKLAWRSGRFKSFERFKNAQRGWMIGGIVWFAASLLGTIMILYYTLSMF